MPKPKPKPNELSKTKGSPTAFNEESFTKITVSYYITI